MKKIIVSILASAALLTSCREDSLLDKDAGNTVTKDQLSEMIAKFPERAFVVTEGFDAGNNKFLIQYNTVNNSSGLHDDFGYMGILLGTEHMTNDFVMAQNHWFNSYYMYLARNVDNSRTRVVWNFYYKVIYNMNNILNLLQSDNLDQQSTHLKGRSLAMRGLAYLDLLRLYGVGDQGIPYYSQKVNENGRVATSTVLEYIEADLLEAYKLLDGYTRENKQSINRNVTAGFLARLYMTKGEYAKAAQYANLARQGYVPMSATQLMDGFDQISNPEWMWGADIDGATTTSYASFFSHIGNKNAGYAGALGVYRNIDSRLYSKIADTDLRKQWFLGKAEGGLPKYANVKFVDDTFFLGDYVFMRAAEMYFIEAEALARSGNESQAKQVLYDIMSKRDLSYTLSTNSGASLLDEININKRIELWGEGQNFYDMKRLKQPLERNYTGSNHISIGKFNYPSGDPKFNFQVPQAELDANTKINNP